MVRRPEVKEREGQDGSAGYGAQSLALAEPEAYQPVPGLAVGSDTREAQSPEFKYAYDFGLLRSAVEMALLDLDKGRPNHAASWLRWALAEVSR